MVSNTTRGEVAASASSGEGGGGGGGGTTWKMTFQNSHVEDEICHVVNEICMHF